MVVAIVIEVVVLIRPMVLIVLRLHGLRRHGIPIEAVVVTAVVVGRRLGNDAIDHIPVRRHVGCGNVVMHVVRHGYIAIGHDGWTSIAGDVARRRIVRRHRLQR